MIFSQCTYVPLYIATSYKLLKYANSWHLLIGVSRGLPPNAAYRSVLETGL